MRSDDDIDLAACQPEQNRRLFAWRSKTREHFHLHGERSESLQKCLIMLLRENCRWHKDRDLLAIHHCLERSAQCNLRFAITHIAA